MKYETDDPEVQVMTAYLQTIKKEKSINIDSYITALNNGRKRICSYTDPGSKKASTYCDCKYLNIGVDSNEHTGCCELRQLEAKINLYPEEFITFMQYNGITILQNAVLLTETNTIIISSHVHDFKSFKIRGIELAIDGGHNYLKRVGDFKPFIESKQLVDLSLSVNSPLQEKVDKLVWKPLYKDFDFIKNFETSHLQNLLIYENLAPHFIQPIIHILRQRQKQGQNT